MNRRIRKRLYTHNGSSWQLSEDLRFVYDQWNPVLVLDEGDDVQRKFTWELDLSGMAGGGTVQGIHGAGGVGGLLSVVETQDTATTADDENYWFVYDGNGNVGQVLDATDTSDVSLAAHYEYDPYGDTLVVDDVDSSGYANDNPYRFSTKWLDDDLTTGDNNGGAIESSGLYYYGYRYYSPNLGRWISRDPIGERASLNLYGFVNNDPIGFTDVLGRWRGRYKRIVIDYGCYKGIVRSYNQCQYEFILLNCLTAAQGYPCPIIILGTPFRNTNYGFCPDCPGCPKGGGTYSCAIQASGCVFCDPT